MAELELNSDDRALFVPALNAVNGATQALQQAQAQFVAAKGAFEYVAAYLRTKYGLQPGDDIDLNGKITRRSEG